MEIFFFQFHRQIMEHFRFTSIIQFYEHPHASVNDCFSYETITQFRSFISSQILIPIIILLQYIPLYKYGIFYLSVHHLPQISSFLFCSIPLLLPIIFHIFILHIENFMFPLCVINLLIDFRPNLKIFAIERDEIMGNLL